MQAQRKLLDAQRWHFQHGPIDLVIRADGEATAVEAAHAAAWLRFEQVLPELVRELAQLRSAVQAGSTDCPLQGPVARRMWHACHMRLATGPWKGQSAGLLLTASRS